jgi:hypothetical protein
MNSAQTDLYQRLQYFELDDPAHEFGFTHHLLEDVPIALLVLILAVKVILYLAPVPQTRWGRQIGSNIKKNHDVYDLAQHVAVHGVKVLSGGALDELKQMFAAVEEEAASSSCGGCGC